MNKKSIKVKILDIEYDKEENIFVMNVLNIKNQENVKLVIRAEDFGVTRVVPIDTINYFCEQMKGKEKNLFIEVENNKINKNEKLSDEKILELDKEFNKYPFEEIAKIISREDLKDEN
ncbi:MAG: hypothetical protein QQN62_07890 [Nitrosopumilus sp.]